MKNNLQVNLIQNPFFTTLLWKLFKELPCMRQNLGSMLLVPTTHNQDSVCWKLTGRVCDRIYPKRDVLLGLLSFLMGRNLKCTWFLLSYDKLGWQDGPMETEHQRRHDRVQQQGDTGAPHHDRCGKQAKKMIIWLLIQSPVSLILKFQVNQLNCSRLLGIMSLRRFLCKPHWQNTQIF